MTTVLLITAIVFAEVALGIATGRRLRRNGDHR